MNYASITNVIFHLKEARLSAVDAGLDHHFVSEIDHLVATAEANMEEEK